MSYADDLMTPAKRSQFLPQHITQPAADVGIDLVENQRPNRVVGSDNARFVSDEVVDRFCLVGPVEAHRQKLKKLAKVGVTQFNIYLMCGDEELTLEAYKRDVLPVFRRAV